MDTNEHERGAEIPVIVDTGYYPSIDRYSWWMGVLSGSIFGALASVWLFAAVLLLIEWKKSG